ncbi:tetratricopeptide repeat protein [Maribacter sp. PR1]|uniref:Tetratricopeptide repeat protein n=1 Tax=Maribacter cobaltidurans TaxID=1178778 RepID=A0ABU7INE9_9FLAO|nr:MULTISPECIES: tetratricopeptide repeat protein [Maribacter]MDC6387106.1 tetratricopeptide repeat protein [Maribacter sp. PR1]MEE1974492.1 tetratricopeptide repeat protein [Maribacter cobaltidurans]
MLKKITAFFPFLMGIIWVANAQESKIYTHENKDFQDALALYNNEQFQAAQTIFEKVKSTTKDEEIAANSAYYVANSAVRLNQQGADRLMEEFVDKYPTSTKRNSAFADVADYYFETGKYPYALKWYNKVDQSALSRGEMDKFNFNYGYSLFSSRKPQEAERYLEKVTTSPVYGSQAKYYLGYISYQQDDYEEANERFDQITDQNVLEEKLSYYQADMNFKLGKFEEAIALAKKQLPKSDRTEVSELNKIIGESYFNLEQYENAIPYLKEYRGKRGKWSNTDYYLLGYCYYKQGEYANAIDQFNKIIGGTNSVSQNAYYHLAECYLKQDKKQEALNAFRNASQMDFKPEIQKDAFLNYARLSYEVGNAYEPVPQVITNYLETYPNDEHKEEMQTLLVDSYITSKNFAGAMELLENNQNYASKETYQKVTYYRGIELFMEGDYGSASEVLGKSLGSAVNDLFRARANYWKAEADYLLNRFDDAVAGFTSFKQNSASNGVLEGKDVDYDLAYAYFKQKDYGNAITYFKAFTDSQKNNVEKLHDGYLRLGDSYFATSKYWPAIETYNEALALTGPEKDYASYQKAMSYGFVDRTESKIENLENFVVQYARSTFKDDALFELGNTYVSAGQENKGLQAYDRLIGEYRGSSLVPQALMRQGLVFYNSSRNNEALAKFKTVVRDFPNTQEAIQAVATAKLVYVDLGRVDEYASWVNGLDFVEVTDAELDNATFDSAQKQNIEGKTDAAIRGYQKYIEEFPNGLRALDANFSLAQLYFGKGDKEAALPYYKYVADKTTSEYAEQALTRVCEVYIGKQDYETALPYLLKLEDQANIQQNRTFAQSNLMKGYYEQKNYSKTLEYADKVLSTSSIDDRIKSDAQIMIARSAIATGDESKAKSAYTQVLTIASGGTAAEALYYDAYFKNQEGDYESSNISVQKLAKDYATYKEWGGKGLVLMAKNFYALGDSYQATYILESVISNFAQFPEIVADAKAELAIIKSKESQSNSSVDPNRD